MRKVFLFFVCIALFSCKENKTKQVDVVTLEKQIVSSDSLEVNKKVNYYKYVFIFIQTSEPLLDYVQESYIASGSDLPSIHIPEKASLSYKNNQYFSKIIEVQNYSEDQKYILMDKFEENRLQYIQNKFNQDVQLNIKDDKNRNMLLQASSTGTVEKRECYVFDSYKLASESLHEMIKR